MKQKIKFRIKFNREKKEENEEKIQKIMVGYLLDIIKDQVVREEKIKMGMDMQIILIEMKWEKI